MATLYGVGGSPFVRKVRVVCAEKNIPYDHEPVFPGQVDRKISPLGKVPGWKDERGPLSDSSIICAYLEGVKPEPALYPRDPYERARALWFEEYGDSALLGVFGPKIFFKKIIGPRFMGQQFDPAEIQKTWDEEAPPLLETRGEVTHLSEELDSYSLKGQAGLLSAPFPYPPSSY